MKKNGTIIYYVVSEIFNISGCTKYSGFHHPVCAYCVATVLCQHKYYVFVYGANAESAVHCANLVIITIIKLLATSIEALR